MNNLFRKKSIEQIKADAAAGMLDHDSGEASGDGVHLRRTLGLFDLTMLGIAAIIGAGIFAMVGKASYNGGPAVIFLFIVSAIACGFAALCYAEFASRIPIAGSAYTYSYASMGELIAWIIGWDLIVEYAIGNIAVAISWSDYFTGLLKGYGIDIPLHFTMDFLTASRGYEEVVKAVSNGATVDALSKACDLKDAAINCAQIDAHSAWANAPLLGSIPVVMDLPALLITALMTTLVYIGIRESKFTANVMTVLKIGIILLVIFLGFGYVNPENWSPFAPNGAEGVLKGVSAVFFAYIGFDALATTAEEAKNPSKDLPRAMILSLVICTILYILLALVITGMVSYTQLNVGDPLAFVFGPEGANIPWVAGIIAVSAVVALGTVFLVFQIGQPRLWMAMSRDGLLPKIFSSIHPKFQTPWFATIVTGCVVAIPALFMNLTEVTDLASIGTLFAFVVVCAGVLFKEKEFQGGTRYVPYINAQFILPILLIILGAVLFYFNGSMLNDFLTVTPVDGESWWSAFSHKIPMISFLILLVTMLFLTLTKKLSLIPILGLLLCSYLMTELGVTNWFRFGIWLLVGLRIYRLYGIRNSNLNPDSIAPKGLVLVTALSVISDILLMSLLILPIFEYFIGVQIHFIINVTVAIIVAVVLEVLTQMMQASAEVDSTE
jgi:amino acid transporter